MGIIQLASRPLYRPTYTAGGGGSLTDGGSYVANSSGLGTTVAASAVEFLGGTAGPVEALANGADWSTNLPTNWQQIGNTHTSVSTAAFYGGTKSLLNDFNDVNNWQFGFVFDTGAGQKALYVRATYRLTNPNSQSTGQAKLLRFMGSASIEDLTSYLYFTRYYGGSGNYIANNGGATIFTSEGGGTSGNFVEKDIWVTGEFLLKPDSTAGAGDGSIQWRHTRTDTGDITTDGTVSGRTIWSSGQSANPFRYIAPQFGFYNEWNNPLSLNISRDFYIAWNNSAATCPKYVLLGNASTFASSTIFSICKWTAWADTQVTFIINKGPHASLSGLYIYFMSGPGSPINSNGVALV